MIDLMDIEKKEVAKKAVMCLLCFENPSKRLFDCVVLVFKNPKGQPSTSIINQHFMRWYNKEYTRKEDVPYYEEAFADGESAHTSVHAGNRRQSITTNYSGPPSHQKNSSLSRKTAVDYVKESIH
jgi:hypothetical protein